MIGIVAASILLTAAGLLEVVGKQTIQDQTPCYDIMSVSEKNVLACSASGE